MTATPRRRSRALPLRHDGPTRSGPRPVIALDALDGHLGYFARRLQIWVFQDFIRTLKRIDISPAQFSVLVVVGANRGLSQAELANPRNPAGGYPCHHRPQRGGEKHLFQPHHRVSPGDFGQGFV